MATHQTSVEIEALADGNVTVQTHEGSVSITVSGWDGDGNVTLSRENVEQLVTFLQSWLARPWR